MAARNYILSTTIAISILATFISGCQLYRADMRQGNYVSQDMVDQLKPNLTKFQVQKIMGTSALTPVLNLNRWDYIYNFKPGKDSIESEQHKVLTLFFKDDKLVSYSGDWEITKLTKLPSPAAPF